MKHTPLYVFLFILAATSIRAYAPHPTIVTAKYKNKMWPVVQVRGTDPIISYQGSEKKLRTEPGYIFDRTNSYADNRIEFSKLSLGGNTTKFVASSNGDIEDDQVFFGMGHGTTFFEATLIAKQAVHNGFAAIVIYSDKNLTEPASRYNRTETVVRELPDLPAGESIELKFKSAMIDGGVGARYFIQIFDNHGKEIPSNVMSKSWRYYALRDREQLKRILPDYLHKNRDVNKGVVPVIMPTPYLPQGYAPPDDTATALLNISSEGLVTKVEIENLSAGPVYSAIVQALEGWLFLPKINAGQPVATRVKVPLKF